jgi:hypothetical protein
LVLALASAALADDGRREISQTCALAGCFAGDGAGFPVVLTKPGSYALTGNLSVADPSQHGISTQSAVDGVFTLDLNGFEIAGPVTCAGQGSTLACGVGAGVGVAGSSAQIVVKSGRVTGFGGGGIAAGPRSRIEGVIADANGGPGIATGPHSLVHHSIARGNEGIGIQVDAGSIVEGSIAADNLSSGIAAVGSGVVVKESTASSNGAGGITAVAGAQLEANGTALNAGTGVSAGAGNAVLDSTASFNQGGGVSAGFGSTVNRNTMRSNTGPGLSCWPESNVGENTNTANTGQSCVGPSVANLVCGVPCLVTHVQGDWGDESLAGTTLAANFASVYASVAGELEVGIPGTAGFSVSLSSVDAAQVFLPQAGAPGPLVADLVDPTSTASGVFVGEVVGLKLNVDFSDAGALPHPAGVPFGDLRLCGSALTSLNGLTVRQILATANFHLGGGSPTIPIFELNQFVQTLNVSFGNGFPSTFAQEHLVPGSCP